MIAQRTEGERRLEVAEKLLAAAEDAHRRDPSYWNRIALSAARRLTEESKAQAQEWRT